MQLPFITCIINEIKVQTFLNIFPVTGPEKLIAGIGLQNICDGLYCE